MVVGSPAVKLPPRSVDLKSPYISVITPIYNEEGNIESLLEKLFSALDSVGRSFEIIAVDDGSRDNSFQRLTQFSQVRRELRLIQFRRNYGQTAAMMAGIDHARGDIIISIDSDLQNDPDDIPMLLNKLDEGFDVVSGWRRDRKDAALRRNFVSRMANRVISRISGVALHDYGCTLKAYRRDMIIGARLYGEMHRFIPIYASWMGARVTEIPVRHYPRVRGHSNYGLERVIKVVLDLVVVKFLDRYFVKPIYVFGGFGAISLAASFLAIIAIFYLKLIEGVSMIQTPLPVFAAMTFLVGILSILMGLLAEILVRIYFESQERAAYAVRCLINFDDRS